MSILLIKLQKQTTKIVDVVKSQNESTKKKRSNTQHPKNVETFR